MGTKNIFFLRKTFNCEVAARTHCSASWSCHQHRYPVSPRSQEHPDGSGCRFFLASQKPLPSSVAGKTQTCWLSHHQTFTSCKYRKLSWGLWVSRKTQHLSIDTISFVFEGTLGHELCLLNDIPGSVKYLCVFFFGIFLLSTAEIRPVANDSLLSEKQWGHW